MLRPSAYVLQIMTFLSSTTSFHSTVHHLHRLSPHPPTHQPLPHLTQPWRSFFLTPPLPIFIRRSAPEDFCSGSCARPEHLIEVGWIGLLGPEVDFAAKNEVLI
jgi:hypothetical protein